MAQRKCHLSCGHRVEYGTQRRGDRAYCDECQDWRAVARVETYSAKCRTCRFGRDYGFSRHVAELGIARHLRRWPTHRVYLLEGDRVILEKNLRDSCRKY